MFSHVQSAVERSVWDQTSRDYHEQIVGPFHPHQSTTALDGHLTELAETPDTLVVLDAGCGIGNLAARHPGLERHNLVGLDMSPGMLRAARHHPYRALVLAHLEHVPFRDNTTDITISTNAIMPRHQQGRRAVATMFHNLVRVTKPGGHVLLVLPSFESFAAEAGSAVSETDLCDPAGDVGLGFASHMHTETTIRRELSPQLEHLTIDRLIYDEAQQRQHALRTKPWDWLVAGRKPRNVPA